MKECGAWQSKEGIVALKLPAHSPVVMSEEYARMLYDDLAKICGKETSFDRYRQELVWARTLDKNLNPLPRTEWVAIKDLDTDHIRAILKLEDVSPIYFETLQQELFLRESDERIKNVCGLNVKK